MNDITSNDPIKEEPPPQKQWMRRFFILWTGQAFSLVGSALVQWALMFWLAVTTASPVVLALAAVMGLLPQVFLSPIAGAYVDRLNRKRVMVLADMLTAISTLSLMVPFILGYVEIWPIFIVLFFRSAMQAFHWPAMQASTTLMVPEEHLARIGGLNQSIVGVSSILGPALGAALYVAFPMYMVLSVDIVTAALAIATMLVIRIPEIRKTKEGASMTIRGEMIEAYHYLRSWKGAMLIVGVFSVGNFLITPAFTYFNLLTLYHFGQGPFEAALIDVMAGIGMIVGGLVLGVWGGTRRKIVTCMGALAAAGGGVLLIGLLPSDGFLIAVAATLVIGTTLSMVNGTIMAIMQKGIRVDMQGRVFALIGSLASGMSPLGLAISGPISDALGIQAWFIVGGVFMIVVGVAAFFVPLIMRIEDRTTETVVVDG